MSDPTDITNLLHRAQEILTLTSSPGRSVLEDDKETALKNYRLILGLCVVTLETLQNAETPARTVLIAATQTLLQIARLCTNEHDRICKGDEARRERSRRWSEVHEEFEASQREGRPMRSEWSWERPVRWEGPIT